MRPLSVDKLNIVISRLHCGQTTCHISSSTGFSIGTISKIHSEHFSNLPKSSGDYPIKLSPANVRHAVNFIICGKAETVVQVSKWGWKGPHLSYHWSWMHPQAHPKAFSPIALQIHLQTSLYPQPVYHLAPLLPFSSFLYFYDRRGFFFFTTAFIPVCLRCLHTVWGVTGWLVICWSAFETCTAVSAFPEVIKLTAWQTLAGESLTG